MVRKSICLRTSTTLIQTTIFVPSSRETAATTIRKTYPTTDSRSRNSKGDELVNVEDDDYTNDGAKDDYVDDDYTEDDDK